MNRTKIKKWSKVFSLKSLQFTERQSSYINNFFEVFKKIQFIFIESGRRNIGASVFLLQSGLIGQFVERKIGKNPAAFCRGHPSSRRGSRRSGRGRRRKLWAGQRFDSKSGHRCFGGPDFGSIRRVRIEVAKIQMSKFRCFALLKCRNGKKKRKKTKCDMFLFSAANYGTIKCWIKNIIEKKQKSNLKVERNLATAFLTRHLGIFRVRSRGTYSVCFPNFLLILYYQSRLLSLQKDRINCRWKA